MTGEMESLEKSVAFDAKEVTILSLLSSENPNVERLRQMCILPEGLLTNEIRRKAWPLLVCGTSAKKNELEKPSTQDLMEHRDYKVVELDVERLLKRYPPDLPEVERQNMASSVKTIIMRTLYGTDHYYYQGFHDIAITVHLVLQNEDASVEILRKLCDTHLAVFMKPTLLETVKMLQYVYPLIKRCNPQLHDLLIQSHVGTMFALPWLITWFGHNIQENVPHRLVVRLCDLFIASDPHMPVYLGAAIVASLADEIMRLPVDQAEVHGFLNSLPSRLPWEALISDALDLYVQFPPVKIALEAAAVESLDTRRNPPHPPPIERLESWKNVSMVIGVIVIGVIAIGLARYYRNGFAADEVGRDSDGRS